MRENPIIKARQQFADANGWKVRGDGFDLFDLAPRGVWCSRHYQHMPWVDHGESYRKDRKPVAIVGHNYPPHDIEAALGYVTKFCNSIGLTVHTAPAGPAASWYLPNGAFVFAITRPGDEVVWPTPEQMARNAAAHALYWDELRREGGARTRRRNQMRA